MSLLTRGQVTTMIQDNEFVVDFMNTVNWESNSNIVFIELTDSKEVLSRDRYIDYLTRKYLEEYFDDEWYNRYSLIDFLNMKWESELHQNAIFHAQTTEKFRVKGVD